MITNKILVTFILLITIFLNSCEVYKKEKITFQNPPKYEYRCSSKRSESICKKVNTNTKVEIYWQEETIGVVDLIFELVWLGGTIYITITSSGSAGLAYFVVMPFASSGVLAIIDNIFDYRNRCSVNKEDDSMYVDSCSRPATEREIKGLEEEIRILEELESY